MENARRFAVLQKLVTYVRSPSLRHIRDPHSLQVLAEEIVQVVDQASSVWTKWEGRRDDVIKAAAPCWVPIDDLRDWLNRLPGPTLTPTDVAQRLRAVWEEPYNTYPKEELKAGCLALFEAEKAQGTEMSAIVGALQDHIEVEEERLPREHEAAYRKNRQDEQARLEQRFLAGADSGWIQSMARSPCSAGRTDVRSASRSRKTSGGSCFGSQTSMMKAILSGSTCHGETPTRR